ncbi:hypothetical protein [Clostridium sardiniense]|uniref:hypothetical protein n=1 Tax=Clostridium sardiniense TaxID=29369 RepID=UPI001958C581|nr:hypothetical protein [Clostridium sardiniense]MBM7835750.1 very-short-patch-repair endonuclease [Clostridium sardiniense]
MRKVFLEDLPKRGNRIDWKKSVGCNVPFIYDDIEGEAYIASKENNYLTIKYNGKQYEISTDGFKKCEFGKIVGKINGEYRIEIDTLLKNEKQDFLIIDRSRRKDNQNIKRRYYKYHCNKCGNEDWIIEDGLLKKHGCNVCNSFKKKIKLGINTIWDTDRWMCDLGISEEDAKKYSSRSGQKTTVICPICNNKRKVVIKKIYERKSIGCSCRNSKSYPEKFIFNMLRQLNISFKTEYSPKWAENKRYDFYIKDLNCIIETHGRQHYEDHTFEHLGGRTLKQEQQNDKYKRESALKNGIKHYIELDCRESNLEYIKNSILKLKLSKLFDLLKVDWLKCAEFAIENTTKQICDYWNSKKENETVENISNKTMIARSTIVRHLKIGASMGLCIYDPALESRKTIVKNHKKHEKKVYVFKDDDLLGCFKSNKELANKSEEIFGEKFDTAGISGVCTGRLKSYKGFIFSHENN